MLYWYEICRYGLMVSALCLLIAGLLSLMLLRMKHRLLPLMLKPLSSWARASLLTKIIIPLFLAVNIVVGGAKREGDAQPQSRMNARTDRIAVVDQLSDQAVTEPDGWLATKNTKVSKMERSV